MLICSYVYNKWTFDDDCDDWAGAVIWSMAATVEGTLFAVPGDMVLGEVAC
jgi:hypothetical protein